ncbi:MAG: hypothetical protein GXO66_00925 [Euryarchaeota archaeon]|nr:hypothetical protein [Euryarchaeota archaeon]
MFHAIYTVSNFLNMVLLIILIYLYLQDYRKVRSTFTLGLVIFAVVLFINALLSCPSIFYLFSGYDVCPFEPYHALASAFETVALVVLLYISTR